MDTPQSQLVGDLSSTPVADRWLWDEEILALDNLLAFHPPEPERSTFVEIIHDRRQMLASELAERVFLTEIVKRDVHHQLRARSDFRNPRIVIEQWVPALQCWLTSGTFDLDTPSHIIVRNLRMGDPRFETPQEALDRQRAASAKRRAQIDAESDLKIKDAIANLSSERLDQFIAVEQALKTGETITSRGDDARFLERATARTKSAAARGDVEAQSVLTYGVRDTHLCVNPGDNPTVR